MEAEEFIMKFMPLLIHRSLSWYVIYQIQDLISTTSSSLQLDISILSNTSMHLFPFFLT